MSKTRVWVFGMIAAMLVVAIGGWMLGISPLLDQVTAATSQNTTIQASNQASQTQLASLKVRFAAIDSLRANLEKLRLSIPEQQSASAFLDEVNALSAATGATLISVVIGNATLYAAPAPAAGVGATATTGTSTASPAPAVTTPTTPIATTTTADGLVIIPVTVNVQGTLEADRQFVGLLQTGQRLFVSSTMNVTSGEGATLMVTSVTGSIFSLKGTSDQPAGTKSTAPVYSTPTPTPTPTATSTTKKGTSGNAAPTAPPVTPTPTPTG